jgi:uncharacterized protein (UPF0212 family)
MTHECKNPNAFIYVKYNEKTKTWAAVDINNTILFNVKYCPFCGEELRQIYRIQISGFWRTEVSCEADSKEEAISIAKDLINQNQIKPEFIGYDPTDSWVFL